MSLNDRVISPTNALNSRSIYDVLDGDTEFPINGSANDSMPYLSGLRLVHLAQDFGLSIAHDSRSRWMYLEEMVSFAIERDRTSDLLRMFFNNPDFSKKLANTPSDEFQNRHRSIVRGAIGQINKSLYFKRVELRSMGDSYEIVPIGSAASVEVPSLRQLSGSYIQSISERALKDVSRGDLDTALTHSRTLLEEAFWWAIERQGESPVENGNLSDLFNQFKGLYNMHETPEADRRINSLISGLNKTVAAIVQMRNKDGDSHGRGSKRLPIKGYQARLAVNSATSLAEFILSVVNDHFNDSSDQS